MADESERGKKFRGNCVVTCDAEQVRALKSLLIPSKNFLAAFRRAREIKIL